MAEDINKKRIIFLDIIRIVSICIIVVYHFLIDLQVNNVYKSNVLNFLVNDNFNLVLLSCALFMGLSGASSYISFENYTDEKFNIIKILKWLRNRFFRFSVPFYITYFICALFKILNMHTYHIFNAQNIPKIRIIFTFLAMDEYLSANGIRTFSLGIGEWFIGCLLIITILFPIIYYANKKYKKLTFIIIFSIYLSFCLGFFNNIMKIQMHMNFLYQIFNFYIGMIFIYYYKYQKPKSNKNNLLFIISFCIILFSVLFNFINKILLIFDFKNSYATVLFSNTVYMILILYMTYYIFDNIKNIKILNIIKIMAKYTYYVFLVHHFIIYRITEMIKYINMNSKKVVVLFMLEVFIIFIFSYIVMIVDNIIKNKIFKIIKI